MREWFRDWFDADYAALYAHRDAAEAARAVETALRLAPGLGSGPVLDLACGAGRHLEALRRANPEAFGIDLSGELLSGAPEALRPWLLRADMRRLPLRRESLSGVCLWFTSFGYFSDAENQALLANLATLLRPGGVLLLDLPNAGRLRRTLVPEEEQAREGCRVCIRRAFEGERLVKRIRIERPDGSRREAIESLHLYAPEALRAMARGCGLLPAAERGDTEGAPFDPTRSPRWLALFRKQTGENPFLDGYGIMTHPPRRCAMSFRTLTTLPLQGRRVFLRADLNVPIKEGQIKDATRIQETLPTLRHLLEGGASVVMASHLGRPEGTGFEAAFSMAPVAAWLKGKGFDVRLASGVTGSAVEAEAAALRPGQVLLLENLRFDKGETKNKPEFCEALARLADTYVNDAFGAAHRAHASVAGMVAAFPPERCAAGFLLEKELKALGRVMTSPEKPLVAVMGGAKVSDKIDLIRTFLPKADAILIGGAMSYTLLKARGVEIGKSLCETDKLALAAEILKEAEAKGCRILLPVDHVAAAELKADADCMITQDVAIPADRMGLDIGPESVALFAEELRKARTIVWNGPMGVFEMDCFAAGTLALAEEMAAAADRGAFVVVGGGDSVSAANKAGVTARMGHVSTGGGASLEFLSGLSLPGVAALER